MEINAADLVSIIKACREANVTHFKTDKVEFFLEGEAKVQAESIVTHSAVTDFTPYIVDQPLTEDEKREMAEIEDANLLFDDPVEWERTQMEGEGVASNG
jgi:hypothetical protein